MIINKFNSIKFVVNGNFNKEMQTKQCTNINCQLGTKRKKERSEILKIDKILHGFGYFKNTSIVFDMISCIYLEVN